MSNTATFSGVFGNGSLLPKHRSNRHLLRPCDLEHKYNVGNLHAGGTAMPPPTASLLWYLVCLHGVVDLESRMQKVGVSALCDSGTVSC